MFPAGRQDAQKKALVKALFVMLQVKSRTNAKCAGRPSASRPTSSRTAGSTRASSRSPATCAGAPSSARSTCAAIRRPSTRTCTRPRRAARRSRCTRPRPPRCSCRCGPPWSHNPHRSSLRNNALKRDTRSRTCHVNRAAPFNSGSAPNSEFKGFVHVT